MEGSLHIARVIHPLSITRESRGPAIRRPRPRSDLYAPASRPKRTSATRSEPRGVSPRSPLCVRADARARSRPVCRNHQHLRVRVSGSHARRPRFPAMAAVALRARGPHSRLHTPPPHRRRCPRRLCNRRCPAFLCLRPAAHRARGATARLAYSEYGQRRARFPGFSASQDERYRPTAPGKGSRHAAGTLCVAMRYPAQFVFRASSSPLNAKLEARFSRIPASRPLVIQWSTLAIMRYGIQGEKTP